MKTLSLALRNLLRNRRRSLTTLLALVIGVFSILMFGGYSRNTTYGLQTGFVGAGGHLQIQRKGYFLYGNGNPTAYGIGNYQRIIDAVRQDAVLDPMLTVVTPTLQVSGIAGNFAAGVSRTVIGTGIIVGDQNRMRMWNDFGLPILPRPLALTGSPLDSAVIGSGVARVLQMCEPLKIKDCQQPLLPKAPAGAAAPSDIAALSAMEAEDTPAATGTRIEVLTASVKGAPNVAALNVVKAEPQGMKELDDIYIAMHLEQAQKLIYGSGEGQVTAVLLQLQKTAQIPAARARLQELLDTKFKDQQLEVHDFAKLNPMYEQSIQMFQSIFGFISVLIGTIVLFTVSNTMSMAVVERTVEIGTLRAMGLRRNGIRNLFVTEGFLLGLIGALTGVLLALLVSTIINRAGLTWIPPGWINPVPLTVHVWGETFMVFSSAIGLVLVAVMSASWPAGRAAKMNVVDALRHV